MRKNASNGSEYDESFTKEEIIFIEKMIYEALNRKLIPAEQVFKNLHSNDTDLDRFLSEV